MWITSPANWWGWNQISSDLSQASYCLAMPPQHAFCALYSYPIILWRVEPHSLSEVCPHSYSRILLRYHWQSRQLLIRHWCHQCLPPTPFGMPLMPQRNPMVPCNTPDHHGQIMWDSHQVGFPHLGNTLLHNNIGNNLINKCMKRSLSSGHSNGMVIQF